jgi:TetR/AcrR family transcriptional regulator
LVVARGARSDDAGDSREQILRAALQTFAEKGFDGSTTREIATRAGVNHGLIPYYFGSKESLWRDAVDRAFGELAAGLEATGNDPDSSDGEQRMGLMIRNFVRFVARHPEFVRLMDEEGKRPGPRMRWLVDRHVKPLYEGVAALVGNAQARGSLPADIPPIHFHYILAGAVGVIFHQAEECRRLTGIDPFDPEHVEQHAHLVEQLFLGAVGRASERLG